MAYDELVRELPPGGESVELLVDGNTVLRGVFVPPAEDGPLVLHLLESGGSVAFAEGGRSAILRQLADLGVGSLMLDWTGVGVSSGERANENLRRDVSAMWREALRRVEGDPSRLIVRAASLGTLAAADLLDRGARPAGLVLVAPVLAETVHRNYAKQRLGSVLGSLFTLGMRDLIETDLLAVLGSTDVPFLLLQPLESDLFVTEAERVRLGRVTALATARFGYVPGRHVQCVFRAHELLDQELLFLEPWLPPLSDAAARVDLLEARMPAGLLPADLPGLSSDPSGLSQGEVRERLTAIQPMLRTQPAELVVAAGLASRFPRAGARLLWTLQGMRGELPKAYDGLDPRGLREAFSLADPAGELPLEWIDFYGSSYRMLESFGSTRAVFAPEDLVRVAWGEGGGRVALNWTWRVVAFGGVEEVYEFEHSALWRSLVARGLSRADARRQFVRVLLFAYGLPHRFSVSEGRQALEVWEEGAWRPLDLETPPAELGRTPLRLQGKLYRVER